ncbi:MAG: DNA polymerase III subunit delta [Planctomycetes bacterium]|nr:DNA polymerase III subunit delta [Planctomycetota bacterium]
MHEPIYVIAGKQEALVNSQCEELLNKLIEPQQRAFALFNADAKQCIASGVFDELRTLPFLSERRVVLIKKADDFIKDNRSLLENYFDNPCPTGILVMTVGSWPSQTKLAKKLTKAGKLITVVQPKSWELPAELTRYAFNTHNKKIQQQTAGLLVELTGDDLCCLRNEVDKLALFVGEEKTITSEHVKSLIGNNRLFNAFEVINAIVAGNIAKAIDRLRQMFAEDKSAEYTSVGAFAFHLRRMFNAKVMLEKGSTTYETANKLRIFGNKDAFFVQLRKINLKQIAANLQRLAQIDYEIKTGRTKANVAIEQMVVSMAGK